MRGNLSMGIPKPAWFLLIALVVASVSGALPHGKYGSILQVVGEGANMMELELFS